MLNRNLTLWDENGVKLQLKFSDQIKIRMKQKQSRNGVGDKIEMI